LEGASQIHIAAYLFNNPIYAEFIKGLVDRGFADRAIRFIPIA